MELFAIVRLFAYFCIRCNQNCERCSTVAYFDISGYLRFCLLKTVIVAKCVKVKEGKGGFVFDNSYIKCRIYYLNVFIGSLKWHRCQRRSASVGGE